MRNLMMMLIVLTVVYCFGQEKPLLVVLDMVTINSDAGVAQAASEIIRTELGGTMVFNLMERSKWIAAFGAKGLTAEQLDDTGKIAEKGALAGADFVVAGSLMKLGSTYTTAVRMVDVKKQSVVFSKTATANSEDNLPDACRGLAVQMGKLSPGTSTPLIAQTPPILVDSVALESKTVSPGLKMLRIPGGTFEMGSYRGNQDEQPVHTTVLDGYWMAEHELTIGQYVTFLNSKKPAVDQRKRWVRTANEDKYSHITFDGKQYAVERGWEDQPLVNVSWHGAKAFCEAYGMRLPTEAEWEYAAGGPKHLRFPWGAEENTNDVCYANNNGKGVPPTCPVKSYRANGFGLFDMAGNVWEWCSDWYVWDYYLRSPEKDPKGPDGGSGRILRGGSWFEALGIMRSSDRDWSNPDTQANNQGFRPVMK